MKTVTILQESSIQKQAVIWEINTTGLGYHKIPLFDLKKNPVKYQETVDGLLIGIISEFSEIFEAYRRDKTASFDVIEELNLLDRKDYCYYFKAKVKGTIQEELADVYIRCLDFIGFMKLDIEDVDDGYLDDAAYRMQSIPQLIMYSVSLLTKDLTQSVKIANIVNNLVIFCNNNNLYLEEFVNLKIKYNLINSSIGDKKF